MFNKIKYHYDDILESFSKGGMPVDDLSRFRTLCQALGNPQDKLKFIHIAGTNGKGSVAEYISTAMIYAGYKVGKFTSPYIINVRERIQYQNCGITPSNFDRLADTVMYGIRTCGDIMLKNLSQFEVLTAIALLYYAERETDIVVLETGIGGLLDCTNIVDPVLTVITAIDYDHSAILGSTIGEIAAHKAGIIKPNRPCVLYPNQHRDAISVVKRKCSDVGANLIVPDIESVISIECSLFGNKFLYDDEVYTTTMGGRHQIANAVTAIEALKCYKIPSINIKDALDESHLPARMQVFSREPILVLDGAHNQQGMLAARELIKPWPVKKILVIGMLRSKDYAASLQAILPAADKVIFTDTFDRDAVPCSELAQIAAEMGVRSENIYSVAESRAALNFAMQLSAGGIVLATGSLYLAGELLSGLYSFS